MEEISWSISDNSARQSFLCGEDEQLKQIFYNFYTHFLTLWYIPPCLSPLWQSQLGICIGTKLSLPRPQPAQTASFIPLIPPSVKYYGELSCITLLLVLPGMSYQLLEFYP